MTDREQAVADAAEALGVELDKFSVHLAVTTRYYIQYEDIEALTIEDAVRQAAELDIDDAYRMIDRDDNLGGVEGDEVLMVYSENGDTREIDNRKPGEPFSWEACQIVKELAKIDPTNSVAIEGIIRRAKEACDTPKPETLTKESET